MKRRLLRGPHLLPSQRPTRPYAPIQFLRDAGAINPDQGFIFASAAPMEFPRNRPRLYDFRHNLCHRPRQPLEPPSQSYPATPGAAVPLFDGPMMLGYERPQEMRSAREPAPAGSAPESSRSPLAVFARPKSTTLTIFSPSSSTSTRLDGFKSQCTRFCFAAAPSARDTCKAMSSASAGSKCPTRFTVASTVSSVPLVLLRSWGSSAFHRNDHNHLRRDPVPVLICGKRDSLRQERILEGDKRKALAA